MLKNIDIGSIKLFIGIIYAIFWGLDLFNNIPRTYAQVPQNISIFDKTGLNSTTQSTTGATNGDVIKYHVSFIDNQNLSSHNILDDVGDLLCINKSTIKVKKGANGPYLTPNTLLFKKKNVPGFTYTPTAGYDCNIDAFKAVYNVSHLHNLFDTALNAVFIFNGTLGANGCYNSNPGSNGVLFVVTPLQVQQREGLSWDNNSYAIATTTDGTCPIIANENTFMNTFNNPGPNTVISTQGSSMSILTLQNKSKLCSYFLLVNGQQCSASASFSQSYDIQYEGKVVGTAGNSITNTVTLYSDPNAEGGLGMGSDSYSFTFIPPPVFPDLKLSIVLNTMVSNGQLPMS